MIDESTIIKQCLQGDIETFSTLVNRYQSRVIALAWNIIGDAEEARDAAQDVFVQAFKNLHVFDLNKNFKSWLMGITVKRSIDRIRKSKSFFKFFKRYIEVAQLDYKSKNRKLEESLIFNPLLKKLNKKERTALSLNINECYSAKEIGAILDCSENTIRVHLYKARKKLKKGLMINQTTRKQSEVIL